MIIKQFFCRHKWEIVKKCEIFSNLNGLQLYKRCSKCGKVIPYRFITNEEEAFLYASNKEASNGTDS